MTTTSVAAKDVSRHNPGRFVQRHPIAAFSVAAFGLGWPLLAIRTMTEFAPTAVGLAFTYLALLGSALAVTRLAGGPGAVRRLLSGLARWRFSAARWVVIVLGLPALTVAIAAATGTLDPPAGGWLSAAGQYLFQTFIFGALFVNLAEETAWSGVVQSRLAAGRSVFRGAMLTAPLFVAMHLPLQFAPGWTWAGVGIGVAALAVIAPFFRFVLGDHLEATGGSLLAVGIQHAAFNASGQLPIPGGWQSLAALIVLAVGTAVHRRLRPARPSTDSQI